MKPIGHTLQVLTSIDSTNNYAMAMIQQGLAEHGTAIFALDQYQGKGQRGREWNSQPGENIAVSVIYKNIPLPIQQQFLFSASIALGVYDFFSFFAGKETSIKWPNDILWGDRKSAGILIENKISSSQNWNWSVVGIGININQENFPSTRRQAISLKQITGKDWDVMHLTKILCQHLNNRWGWMQKSSPETIMEAFNNELYMKGKSVRLKFDEDLIQSTILQVNQNGQLETEGLGGIQVFNVGEIDWLQD